jgi:D-alanine-D-alanine ligase
MTIQVNVVMGGPSVENEISLKSGREVISNLDRTKYKIRAVVVSKSKNFFFSDIVSEIPSAEDIMHPEKSKCFSGPFSPANSALVWEDCQAAFLALHGEFGEDGVIQGYLEAIGIPYTGSGVYGSAVAMNKITSKYLYIQSGLDVPPYSVFGKRFPEITPDVVLKRHGFPCFIKCPQSGSSRLMGKAENKEQLCTLLDELSNHADEILIESTITGPEFTCGVMEMADGSLKAFPPIEIRPVASAFFDFTAKYSDGASEEIVPAPWPEDLLKRIQTTALAAHKILQCSGVSRTDMIYQFDKLHVLETNTLPGLTPNSLLPKAFKATGGTYPEMLDVLIQSTLKKGRN